MENSNPILTHVTIGGNYYMGIEITGSSAPILTNTIIWDNNWSSSPTHCSIGAGGAPIITYSDIKDGWEGESNIDADPLFADSTFTLQEGSPCIDSGHPDLWYADVDGTTADMGATGGVFVIPNFTSYDFGEVGDLVNTAYFTLYNYRDTSIAIDSVSFSTSSFSTDTVFPLTINPFEMGVIAINCLLEELDFLKGDCSKAQKELGWKHQYTFESMLDEMIDYWFNNQNKLIEEKLLKVLKL